MFDDVFDDKQWKIARDKTGLKDGLTEKVSMGDEFKRFQKDKTVDAARFLLQKVEIYERQLKDKHAREKYYNALLKVIQDQKAALEMGIHPPETPVQNGPTPKEMDDIANEAVEMQKEYLRGFDNTNNDPNCPIAPAAKRIYLKVTKEFPTVEGKIKSERLAVTEILQKCKALGTNPNLQAKPEVAITVAQKILETLVKSEAVYTDLHTDFVVEAAGVRKEEGRETNATKEVDKLLARLNEEMAQIADGNHACRLSLKTTLQSLGNNPKAQEMVGQLHV